MQSNPRKSRLLVFSPRVDAYVDSIAALVQRFHPDTIEFAFLYGGSEPPAPARGQERLEFIRQVQLKLSEVGDSNHAYREAETVDLIPASYSQEDPEAMLKGIYALDVTGAPKKLTVELVALALRIGCPKIYTLQFSSRYDAGMHLRVGRDAYEYIDLTALHSSEILRRSYAARANLLIVMGVCIAAVSAVAAIGHWIPTLSFINDALVAISVATGFAGLYLAVRGQ